MVEETEQRQTVVEDLPFWAAERCSDDEGLEIYGATSTPTLSTHHNTFQPVFAAVWQSSRLPVARFPDNDGV